MLFKTGLVFMDLHGVMVCGGQLKFFLLLFSIGKVKVASDFGKA